MAFQREFQPGSSSALFVNKVCRMKSWRNFRQDVQELPEILEWLLVYLICCFVLYKNVTCTRYELRSLELCTFCPTYFWQRFVEMARFDIHLAIDSERDDVKYLFNQFAVVFLRSMSKDINCRS